MPFDPDQPVDYSQLAWPTLPPLSDETIWAILRQELPDMVINQLIWQALGYEFHQGIWRTDRVAADWRKDYPEPPDFIGGRPASVKLTRSIPSENKQLLKEYLGFPGYKIGEFGPPETRRATAANWLLSYMQQHDQLGK
jgi:hypothetical protein